MIVEFRITTNDQLDDQGEIVFISKMRHIPRIGETIAADGIKDEDFHSEEHMNRLDKINVPYYTVTDVCYFMHETTVYISLKVKE